MVDLMKARKDGGEWWLILDRGEEVKSTIEQWAKKEKICGAFVSGIGAVTNVELSAYHPQKKEWTNRKFGEYYELLSLSGNLNDDGLHAHMIIGGLDFGVFGGHLARAEVSVLGEFIGIPTDPLKKTPLMGTLLKKIDLGKK